MISHCLACWPHEACGMLAGSGDTAAGIYEMTNTEASPVSYVIDPGEQFRVNREMREKGQRLVAIYHSHPQSPPYPSATDVSLAFYDDAVYVIVGLTEREAPVAKGFRIVDGKVEEVSITLTG